MSGHQVKIDSHRADIESIIPADIEVLKMGVDVRIEICKIHAMLAIVSALEMIYEKSALDMIHDTMG